MQIGLLGYGTVGRAVDEVIADKRPGLEVTRILRRKGKADGPRMTDDIAQILSDPGIGIVVECLPGRDPALGYIRQALEAGKHVVTSNKAAVAADLGGLLDLARRKGAMLLFEAACGGGMPVVEAIKKAARLDAVNAVSGILNGTCNFILDKMDRLGESFATALKTAQELGYAEADPTADITGADVRNKAIIAASLAFGGAVASEFPMAGIDTLTDEILAKFMARGKRLRLMMLARREGSSYALGVVPVVYEAASFEANVRENFNFARLSCDVVGDLLFYGQGAGGRPTADAVVQDAISVASGTAFLPRLDAKLAYDPSVLSGTGYLQGEAFGRATLEELVEEARARKAFLAFEPD